MEQQVKCAHRVCDVIIARTCRETFPALVAIVFLLALDYTLQLGTCLYLTAAVYEGL